MQLSFLLGLMCVFTVFCEARGAECIISDRATGAAPIIVFKDAPPRVREAAETLATSIAKISGVKPTAIDGAPATMPERAEWTSHGEKVPHSERWWYAIPGPDTPSLGERKQCAPVQQAQIAATLAALLGEDFRAVEPQAAGPITDALSKP